MLERELVLRTISEMPQKFSVDELLERIIFLYKVENGLEQSEKGQLISLDAFDKKYAKWLI